MAINLELKQTSGAGYDERIEPENSTTPEQLTQGGSPLAPDVRGEAHMGFARIPYDPREWPVVQFVMAISGAVGDGVKASFDAAVGRVDTDSTARFVAETQDLSSSYNKAS